MRGLRPAAGTGRRCAAYWDSGLRAARLVDRVARLAVAVAQCDGEADAALARARRARNAAGGRALVVGDDSDFALFRAAPCCGRQRT